jgi:hypothetical protein
MTTEHADTASTSTRRGRPRPAAPDRAAPRHFPARYKIGILAEYDTLGRAGKTELLRRERLRASQVSQWRKQVYEAALHALGAEPGSQPARRVHVSDSLWTQFTAIAAQYDPPFRPERLIRAYIRWVVGVTDYLPPRPEPAATPGPAESEDGG